MGLALARLDERQEGSLYQETGGAEVEILGEQLRCLGTIVGLAML